jgi:hypothetical protein
MSLNWSLDKIEGYKELCWKPALDEKGKQIIDSDGDEQVTLEPITDCLIWGTMCVEMGTITEKTYKEFHKRLVLAHAEGFAPSINYYDEATKDWAVRIPTLEETKLHIGLSTNVYARGKNPGIRAFNTRLKRARKENEPKSECARGFEKPGSEDMSLVTA